MKRQLVTFIGLCSACVMSYADTTITTNTGNTQPPSTAINTPATTPPPPATQPNQGYNSPRDIRPGVYTTENGNGSSSTNYTTGTKNPYIIDNNSNNTAPPAIYPQVMPWGGCGSHRCPHPGPGPRPGPLR